MKPKVLMVNTGVFSLPPQQGGGTEYHIYYLSNTLAEMNVPVHLASNIIDTRFFSEKMDFLRVRDIIPNTAPTKTFFEWSLRHLVGPLATALTTLGNFPLEEVNLIHLHGRLSAAFMLLMKKLLNLETPVIYTLHDRSPWREQRLYSPPEEVLRKMEYLLNEVELLKNSAQVITVSKGLKEEILNLWKIGRKKVNLIYNGVATNEFRPLEKEPLILYVGRFTKRKNLPVLLKAFQQIQPTKYKLILVGRGEEKEKIRKMITEMNIKDQVRIFEGLSDTEMRKLYGKASIFVLPSKSEGFSLSLLEAMSSECVPISTKVSSVPGLIENGVNGFLIPSSDVGAISQNLEYLIEHPNQRRKMGENSRATVIKDYDWRSIATKTVKVYKKALSA